MRKSAYVLAVAAIFGASGPAGAQGLEAALEARNRLELQCAAAMQPVHSPALSNKLLLSLADQRPELMADQQTPSPAEIASIRAYGTVMGACFADLTAWAAKYVPAQAALTARTRADMLAALGDLADGRATYAQANRRLLTVWTSYQAGLEQWRAAQR